MPRQDILCAAFLYSAINSSITTKEVIMTKFSLLQELTELQDLAKLEEGVDTSALTNSNEFKAIAEKDPKMAKALSLQWGEPEFFAYVEKVINGIKNKDAAYKNITPDNQLDLSRLVKLHKQKFPNVKAAEQAPKSKENYKWNDENTDVRTRRESLEFFKTGLTESQFNEFCENLGIVLID